MHTCKTNKKVEDDNRFLGEKEILMPLWGQIISEVEFENKTKLPYNREQQTRLLLDFQLFWECY
jgi:hypothetical protein